VDVGVLVVAVRESSGVSIRRLADAGDVAGSTITRIQAGVVDPSVRTLQRIFDAAGFDLVIGAVRHGTPRHPGLGDLTGAWSLHQGFVRLKWPQWRGLLDRLALHPELVAEAIYPAPLPSGHRVVDALIAALAEKLADDADLARPSWTVSVPGLDEPFRPRVGRHIVGRSVPDQLSARGLLIDTESLWRQPETIGV
jgi:transcriptional regulator with XRE-family HTH domain